MEWVCDVGVECVGMHGVGVSGSISFMLVINYLDFNKGFVALRCLLYRGGGGGGGGALFVAVFRNH